MKKINFVNSIPESKTKELAYWLILTITLISLIISFTLFNASKKIMNYYGLQKQRKQLEQQLNTFESLSDSHRQKVHEKEILEKEFIRLKKNIEHPKNPSSLINLITTIYQKNIQLDSCIIQKKNITLHGSCMQTSYIFDCIKMLKQSDLIKTVRLTSLQPNNQKKNYSFILQAKSN